MARCGVVLVQALRFSAMQCDAVPYSGLVWCDDVPAEAGCRSASQPYPSPFCTTAGTFEEKALSLGWVQEQLAGLLAQLWHSHAGAAVTVTGVAYCTGEAHQWIRRGKKTAGFELTIEFRWRVQLNNSSGAVVTGTAK